MGFVQLISRLGAGYGDVSFHCSNKLIEGFSGGMGGRNKLCNFLTAWEGVCNGSAGLLVILRMNHGGRQL